MALLVAAALLGLTGDGPLSRARTAAPDGSLTVHYNRFLRFMAPAQITIEARKTADSQREVILLVDREYLEGFEVRAVMPEPLRTESRGSFIAFVFLSEEGGRQVSIQFQMQAQKIGRRKAVFGLPGKDTGRFSQLVFI